MQGELGKEKIQEICVYLEDTAKMMGLQLQKNVTSVSTIEDILNGLKELGAEGPLNGAAFMSGIYLGEILKNELVSGEWAFSEEYQQYGLSIHSEMIFPLAKVKKFINDPSGEGLVFYTQALIAKFKASTLK